VRVAFWSQNTVGKGLPVAWQENFAVEPSLTMTSTGRVVMVGFAAENEMIDQYNIEVYSPGSICHKSTQEQPEPQIRTY